LALGKLFACPKSILAACSLCSSKRRYQKGKIRKVKTNLDLLEQETVSAGLYASLHLIPDNHANHANIPTQYTTTI